ncbi:Protein fam49b [Trebouxia sp. C0010 RCD-2024]
MKKAIPAVVGLVVVAGVAGGVTYAVVSKKKKQKAAAHSNAKPPGTKPPAPASLAAPTVEATPLPVNMTDAQAETWAGNLPIITTGKDYHAGIAASTVLLPLMNMGMTADQLKKYNVSPPNDTTRAIIQRFQQDVIGPGDMTDNQAVNYGANWRLWVANSTSQADRNAATRALAPLVKLRQTPYQFSLSKAPVPDDRLRKAVAADFATLQETGNAPMN